MMRASMGVSSPFCPMRVTRSVPVFMVQFHGAQVGRKAGNAFENSSSDHGMLANQGEFLVGKATGFLQNAVSNADFSNVVQKRPDPDSFHVRSRKSESRRDSA